MGGRRAIVFPIRGEFTELSHHLMAYPAVCRSSASARLGCRAQAGSGFDVATSSLLRQLGLPLKP
jgi:hypothetical protein